MCGQISCNFVIVLIFIGYSSKIAQMKHNLNGLHCKFWGLLKAIRGLFFLFYTKLGENMKLCQNLLNFSYGAKLAKWKIISGGIIVLRDMDHFETIRGRLSLKSIRLKGWFWKFHCLFMISGSPSHLFQFCTPFLSVFTSTKLKRGRGGGNKFFFYWSLNFFL